MIKVNQKMFEDMSVLFREHGVGVAEVTIEADIDIHNISDGLSYVQETDMEIPIGEIRVKYGSFKFNIKNRK
jgi:hypothetical protein